jgi:hypothetical protein
MTNILKLAGVATMAIVLTQSLQANQISGNIGFTGLVEYNTTSAGTASDVVGWANTQVLGTSGSFTTIANGTAASFTSATWALATSSTIDNFWVVGGFTFDLLSSHIVSQGYGASGDGFVVVSGSGQVSNDGGATWSAINWSFTSQDPAVGSNPEVWTFSASANNSAVPDGGATVILLGITLSGVALLRKKLVA